ncbi:MAG TPA: helix-turn-helix domain-containing protein [Gemmatimonadaceae bacterium]|nr:helix-turn-helix domain-containing protein [Gemmatimonadaceae bacterium]
MPARSREPLAGHPLDQILGTVAAVRVLRELCPGGEYAPPHIARRTGISRPAVREALIRLERQQIIERVGQGRNLLYRLVPDHPLARRITKLFKAELKSAR